MALHRARIHGKAVPKTDKSFTASAMRRAVVRSDSEADLNRRPFYASLRYLALDEWRRHDPGSVVGTPLTTFSRRAEA